MTEQAKRTGPIPSTTDQAEQLTDAQKWYAAIVCVVAALAMRYAGLLALWPRDPDLPVSLIICRYPLLGVVEMMAIGAVTSALVVVAIGRRLPGIGVVAAAAGLLFLGWSDAQWRLVVVYAQSAAGGQWSILNMRLVGETLGWAAMILCALVAERIAREWIASEPMPAANRVSIMYSRSSALVRSLTQSHEQWLMMLAAGLGGTVLIEVLYSSSVTANLGQGYFIAAVAMLGGVLLGHQVFTVKPIWPAALAWVVPAIAGRIWATMSPDVATQWWLKGINPLADMLPIQYAAGGTIGGIIGLWVSHMLLQWRQEQQA
jgi:hypothetical protein